MADFTFNWNDGAVSTIPLPSTTGWNCDRTSPSQKLLDFPALVTQWMGHSEDLTEKLAYCQQAEEFLSSRYIMAKSIYDTWRDKVYQCGTNQGLCWHCFDCPCYCSGTWKYCYKSHSTLEGYRNAWKNIPTTLLNARNEVLATMEETLEQMTWDLQYAEQLALVQQLIAETNQIISITAYNNESLELEVAAKKTGQIFMPIIIGLIILGVGFYLYKK